MGKWGLGPPGSEGDPLAGLRPLLRLQLPAPRAQPLPDVPLRRRSAAPARQPGVPGEPEAAGRRRPGRSAQLRRLRREGLRSRPHRGARPGVHPRQQGPALLPLSPDHGASPGAPGARGLARRVPRLWPDPPYRGDELPPAPSPRATYAAMVTRMDREVGRDPRPRPRAGPRRADDRRVHVGQRPDLRAHRRLGLRVLPLGRPVPRPQGLALRGRRPRARDREVDGEDPRRAWSASA